MNLKLGNWSIAVVTGSFTGPVVTGSFTGPLLMGTFSAGSGEHDIVLDSDGSAILENNLAQRVDVRLRTFLGEHWLNPEIGVPYFDEFLVKNPNLSVCRALLLTVIQGVPGVREVTRLDLSFSKNTNARVLRVIFTVVGTDSIPQTGTTVVPA